MLLEVGQYTVKKNKKHNHKHTKSTVSSNQIPKRSSITAKESESRSQNESRKLLVSTAVEYHHSYASQVAYDIEFHKHLSVLMPALIGLYPFPLNIYQGLEFRSREYIITSDHEDVISFNEQLIHLQRENDCIYPIQIDDFMKEKPNGDCYVLFDLSQEERNKLSSILIPKKDTVVISVGRLDSFDELGKSAEARQASAILNELYQITTQDGKPHGMIFPVNSILDIRDIKYADDQEKVKLVSRLYDICSVYETDYGVKDDTTETVGNAEKLVVISRAQSELEFEKEILKSIAASAGVDMISLEAGIKEITDIKKAFAAQFDAAEDPVEREKLEAEFQNKTTDLLVGLTKKMLTLSRKEKYETALIDNLSRTVWDQRLSERSRTYLISAMMTYDTLNSIQNNDNLDYSGVCLQITKVLDEELSDRFYTKYKEYLAQKYAFDRWPDAMKSKDGKSSLPAGEFTLGTISYVMGANASHLIGRGYASVIMREYARNVLYPPVMTDEEIDQRLSDIVVCAEKTRTDYRNPAAHRETISYISATECIAYLIEQTKMIRMILESMRV